jgi:endoglycosylceramidase
MVGWTYWSWKYYDDPTGSSDESLVAPDGQLKATAAALARAYPEAVAGTPKSMAFDPTTGAFTLSYVAEPRITAPTLVAAPALAYPNGYCPTVSGGDVVSRPDARMLEVQNSPGAGVVAVSITAGRCP